MHKTRDPTEERINDIKWSPMSNFMHQLHRAWWKQKPVGVQFKGTQEKNKQIKKELIGSKVLDQVEVNIEWVFITVLVSLKRISDRNTTER